MTNQDAPRRTATQGAETPRLRIVHVVDYLMPLMGYQEWLLPKWNARRGHEVQIITSDRFTPVPEYERTWGPLLGPRRRGTGEEEIDGVRIRRLGVSVETGVRPWLQGLEAALAAACPEVVFAHGASCFTAVRVARLARRRGWPLLIDSHMVGVAKRRGLLSRAYYAFLRRATRRWLVPAAHRFVAMDEECARFLAEEQGVPPGRIATLPFGVDVDLFAPDPAGAQALRERHGIPADARVLLQTGKLTRDKAPALLAAAAAPLMQEDEKLWLVYVGAGPAAEEQGLRDLLAAAGVLERLRILPLMPAAALSAAYSAATICVYPAASSLSAFEAAACGRPVVMTDLPECRWRAERGIGLCYPRGEAEKLRETLAGLLEDPAAREEQGARARGAVLESFSYDTVAAQAEALMREAVTAAPAPAAASGPSVAEPRRLTLGLDAAGMGAPADREWLRAFLRAADPRACGIETLVVFAEASLQEELPEAEWLIPVAPALLARRGGAALWRAGPLGRALAALRCDGLLLPRLRHPGRIGVPSVALARGGPGVSGEASAAPPQRRARLARRWRHRCWRRTLEGLSGVAFSSRADRGAAERLGLSLPPHRTVVLPPVPRGEASPAAPASGTTKVGRAERVVLWLGEFAARNAPWTAVAAVRRLRDQGRDLRLLLAGDGAGRDTDRLRQAVAEADGLGRFTRLCPDPDAQQWRALLEEADVLLCAGTADAWSPRLAAALASGLPRAAARQKGLLERLGPEAITFAPAQAESVADALTDLLESGPVHAPPARDWPTAATELLRFTAAVALAARRDGGD